MNKADGTVLISLDVEDNVSSVINKINDRFKDLGKGAGDEMEKSMKSNAQRVEEQATKTAKNIDSSLGKPVKAKVTLDDRELKIATKESEKAIKEVAGDHVSKIDVKGDSVGAFKKMKNYLFELTGKHDVEVNGEGNANEYLAKLKDNTEEAKNSGLKMKDVFTGTFLGGAVLQGIQAVGGSFGDLISETLDASDAMDKFKATMNAGGFGKKEIQAASKEVQKYADETVYDFGDVSNTTAQLAANGVKGYMKLTEAAGNMNAVFGGTADTFKSVAMVLTQTAGAGKLTTENWNQMADAIPGASGVLQKAMKKNGAYTGNFRDAMEAGQISSDEFNKAITQLGMNQGAVKAAKSTKTFEGAFGSLQAEITGGIRSMIDAFGKNKLTGSINSVTGMAGKLFKSLTNGVKSSKPVINDFGKIFGSAFSIIGKTLETFGKSFKANLFTPLSSKSLGKTLDGISNGFSKLAKQVKPVGVAVGGLAGVIGAGIFRTFAGLLKGIANGFGSVKKSFDGKEMGKSVSKIAAAFNQWYVALRPLNKATGELIGVIGGTVIKSAVKILSSIVKTLGNLFGIAGDGKHKALDTVSDIIGHIAKNKTAVKVISDAIIAMMAYKVAKNGLNVVDSLLRGMVGSYKSLRNLPGLLKAIGNTKVKSGLSSLASTVQSIGGGAKTLWKGNQGASGKAIKAGGASTMAKTVNAAAGVGVAADAGLDIYKAFKAKNPEGKFKNAGKGIGTAIGGGIGLFFGGPMGAMLGATFGKVIGGWGGKAIKSFTDGWNKKGRDAKPPKGILQSAGYYARAGADAAFKFFKGLAKWFSQNKKVIITTLINPFAGLATWFLSDTKLGKSVSKWFSNALKSAPKAIGKGWKSVTKVISGWGKSIGKILAPVGKAFSLVWKGIEIGINTFVKGLKIILLAPIVLIAATVVAVWGKIKKPVIAVTNAITKVIKSAFKGLKSFTKSTWKAISKYIISPIQSAVKTVTKTVKRIASAVRDVFNSLLKWVKKTWKKIGNAVTDVAKSLWKPVKKAFKRVADGVHDVFNSLAKWVKKIWRKIEDTIVDLAKSIWKNTKKWFNRLSDAIHDIFNPLLKWIRKIWKKIKDTIEDVANSIYKSGKKIFGKLRDSMKSIGNSIAKTWKSTWKGVAGFFSDIWKGIKKTAQDGINGVIGFLNGGIGGIDKVIHAFGGKSNAIGKIAKVHLATGTGAFGNSPRRAITKPTPAIVNDGMESDNRELIFRSSGAVEMFNHKNAQTLLMPGDEVASASESAIMAPMLGIEHFATGTGAFGDLLDSLLGDNKKDKQSRGFLSDVTSSIGKAVGGAASTVGGWVKSGLNGLKNLYNTAKKIIDDPMKAFASSFKFGGKKIPGVIQNIATGSAKMVGKEAKNWWGNLWSMADLDGSAAGGNWSHSPGSGWTHTDTFGSGRANGTHDGNDFSAAQGTPIHAVHGGKVTRVGGAPSGWGPVGYNIVTKGDDGQYVIYQEFGHASDAFVSKGDTVKTGQKIAKLGNSGLGTGPHVHIGVSKNYPFNNNGLTTRGWEDLMKMSGGSSGVSKKNKGKSDKGLQKKIKGQVGGRFFKFIQKLADKFAPKDDFGSGGGNYNKDMILKAAHAMHVNPTDAFIKMLQATIQSESGGRNIVQQIHDSNSGGNEARGILQFTPGTFNTFAVKGHKNIMDPYDQLLAFFNNSNWKHSIGHTNIWGTNKIDWLHSGPIGHRRFANGGWAVPGLLNIFGEIPGEPELAINPKRATADGHIAEAIQARAKEAPNSFSGKMAMVAGKVKQGLPTISSVPNAAAGSSVDTKAESKLGQLLDKLSNGTSNVAVKGDVFLDGKKVGKIMDNRSNEKLARSMYWTGQVGKV